MFDSEEATRATAVNIARNISQYQIRVTQKGVTLLAEAVLAMDKELAQTAGLARQIPVLPSAHELGVRAFEWMFGADFQEEKAEVSRDRLGFAILHLVCSLQNTGVLSSKSYDWHEATTVVQRVGDVLQLLCAGQRPSEGIIQSWLKGDDEELQNFCADNGPPWAQGIGLIDLAMLAVNQPTEGVDHEYLEDRADQKRLVRELDVILNGEEGAAPQASLCDIVSQVKQVADKYKTANLLAYLEEIGERNE